MEDHKTSNDFKIIDLFRAFGRGKWWFIVTFIIVLVAGVFISLAKPDQYSVKSIIGITDNYIYYNDFIYQVFPEEAEKLWIFPKGIEKDWEDKRILRWEEELGSNSFLEELSSQIDYIDKSDLDRSFTISRDEIIRKITITTYHSSSEITYRLNEDIINVHASALSQELDLVRLDLIQKIDDELTGIKGEINELSSQLEEDPGNYFLGQERNSRYFIYNNMEQVEASLVKNKDSFINRTEILKAPELSKVQDLSNSRRDIVVSIFAALIIGIIAAFVANWISSIRYSRRL